MTAGHVNRILYINSDQTPFLGPEEELNKSILHGLAKPDEIELHVIFIRPKVYTALQFG